MGGTRLSKPVSYAAARSCGCPPSPLRRISVAGDMDWLDDATPTPFPPSARRQCRKARGRLNISCAGCAAKRVFRSATGSGAHHRRSLSAKAGEKSGTDRLLQAGIRSLFVIRLKRFLHLCLCYVSLSVVAISLAACQTTGKTRQSANEQEKIKEIMRIEQR